jgi:hypothetical protein
MASSEGDRLQSWFDAGLLLRPGSDIPTSVHLARAVACLCGVDLALDEPARAVARCIGEAQHLVFVLADGLGLNLLEARPAASFLRSHMAMELRSVFPSSTAPALTSLATGLWPSEHGLPAWFLYLPEQRRQVISLPFVESFTRRPLDGATATSLYPAPVLMPRFDRNVAVYQPASIADSIYTRYIQGGNAAEPYPSLAAGTDAVIARIEAAASATYTHFYYGSIDAASHIHGPGSAEVRDEVDVLEHELERLAQAVAGRARLVVSADHGLYDVPPPAKLMVEPEDELSELLLTPPAGESRVPLFHCRPGAAEEFARRFHRRFGDRVALLSPDEVESLRLMGPGPLSPVTRSRLGDLIGFSARGEGVVYAPDTEVAAMKGFHGGLSPEEVRVPLIVV